MIILMVWIASWPFSCMFFGLSKILDGIWFGELSKGPLAIFNFCVLILGVSIQLIAYLCPTP